MIDEVSWRPEPPAGHRVRSRFLALTLALGAVLLAALAGAAVVWLPGGERRHPSGATAVRSAPVTGPPDSAVTASPAVNAARASVVQVMGTAPSCGRRLAGSGFVYATERVLTPAHVLAGMKGVPTVNDGRGRSFAATVVIFDPERDLAVLRVPGLTAPALRLQENARVGDVGVILGYPRNGGLREIPARIQQVSIAKGPDIYGRHMASRQVFALYGGITRGMSGGPLVTTAGTVSAMVFATDLGSAQGSFALTARELSSQARAGTTAVTAVSTGPCSD